MQVMSALVAEIAGSRGEQAGVGAFLTKAPPALTADRLKSRFSTGVLEHRAHELGWWLHALLALCVEPPRVLRRLFSLRGLSHEQEVEPVFT